LNLQINKYVFNFQPFLYRVNYNGLYNKLYIIYILWYNRRYNHVNLVILHAILDSIRIRF